MVRVSYVSKTQQQHTQYVYTLARRYLAGELGPENGTLQPWCRWVQITLTDGAVFKFWRRRVASQRPRIARYLNILSWMCQAQPGWPKWQKYHALRGGTALEPKFYVKKRLALPCAAPDFSPPEGAEGETHAWPRSRLITGFRGGEAKDPLV